jgi:hypothetical protein
MNLPFASTFFIDKMTGVQWVINYLLKIGQMALEEVRKLMRSADGKKICCIFLVVQKFRPRYPRE